MEYLIGLVLGVFLTLIVVFILRSQIFKGSKRDSEEAAKLIETQLRVMIPEMMTQSSQQLVMMANEKLGSEKKEIKTDMENKRAEIERLVKQIQVDLKDNQKMLTEAEKERIDSFSKLKERLESQTKITEQLRVSTDELKRVLSNNQTRGAFGEKVAEDLLKIAGFVKGLDYDMNKMQEGSGTRPDFIIYLPDGARVNVDAKFPYANLQKLVETEVKEDRDRYQKLFEQDVKEKIRQVATRDYINPEDNTVDFVILFIPNEMIFSYIYEKLNDIWMDGLSKKVILAGPFSFTAILRMVRSAHDNFKYQKNVMKTIGNIKEFHKQFDLYSEEFEKIGKKIFELQTQYDKVNTTRTRKLQISTTKAIMDESDLLLAPEVDLPEQKSLLD